MGENLPRNLVVAQSGGPTAVINSSISGIVTEATKSTRVEGIYGAINGILGVLKEDLVDLRREDPNSIQRLRQTPSAALGSCRYKLNERDYDRLLEVFRAHKVGYFLCAGGNDSMDTAHKVAQLAESKNYELQVIGVPKTVDNDLMATDHCPGYGSVARFNATATRDSGLDTEAIYTSDTIKIMETMGRDTGWITASTALGKDGEDGAPHLIYLPERPFIAESFLEDVKNVYDRLGRAVICVCEGLKNEEGEFLKASSKGLDTDKFGHAQLGGVGEYLVNLISNQLKIKARCDKPGTIQRVSMVCASQVDLSEAYEVGQFALSRAIEGESDKMVTLTRKSDDPYVSEKGLVDLDEVALRTKKVPEIFINKKSNYVTDSFLKYSRPLIGGPLPPYAHLKKERLQKHLPQYM
ncbi:MAG TPA: 6-phosphofructokinase [Candidatus Acidoferrales bacterium]|nr:6-phosphofructokinase [Candidatus Acidoferrales bacterium]